MGFNSGFKGLREPETLIKRYGNAGPGHWKRHVWDLLANIKWNREPLSVNTISSALRMDINYESVDSTLLPDKLKLRIFANDQNITEVHVSFIRA